MMKPCPLCKGRGKNLSVTAIHEDGSVEVGAIENCMICDGKGEYEPEPPSLEEEHTYPIAPIDATSLETDWRAAPNEKDVEHHISHGGRWLQCKHGVTYPVWLKLVEGRITMYNITGAKEVLDLTGWWRPVALNYEAVTWRTENL